MTRKINVKLNSKTDRSYDILLGNNIIRDLGKQIKTLNCGNSVFIITDSTVARLYLKKVTAALNSAGIKDTGKIILKPGEKEKNFLTYMRILNAVYDFDKNQQKKILILTLGGGVVGDLGGFVASTYRRGINYVQVPTTLLGLVDCGMGGKTAFNFREAKNLIGAFWQPKLVFMDVAVLKTLPLRELRSGLAEAVKYGVIKDKSLFNTLEKHMAKLLKHDTTALLKIIPVCVKLKASITSKDERDEKDIRILLNFGHTLGHAIESATNYRRFKHGEAVSIGMILAGKLGVRLSLLKETQLARLTNLLLKTGLPVTLKGIKTDRILSSMRRDKKFIAGVNRFVVPFNIGKAKVVENIPEKLIREVLSQN